MSETKTLPFQVIYATSETNSNPASNIMDTSPLANGWLSIPNSSFPQEIILDFGAIVCLTELKFVSHQSKIASNINLLSGGDISNWRKIEFEPLDSFQFTDNSQNNYRAREIRVAHLPMIRIRYLKLSITDCYQSRFNKSNQVGIISVSAKGFGETDIVEDEEVLRLERLKQEAVDREDFDKAKEIKAKIDIIKDNRSTLTELKQRKIDAIRNEDYDLAKRLKYQEDQLLAGNDSLLPSQNMNQQQYQQQQQQQQQQPNYYSQSGYYSQNQYQDSRNYQRNQRRQSLESDIPQYGKYNPGGQQNAGFESEYYDDVDSHLDYTDRRPIKPMKTDLYAGNHKPLQYDDNWDNQPIQQAQPPQIPDSSQDYDMRPIRTGKPSMPPMDDQGDHLEELDENQRIEADLIIQIAGEEAVRQFYSKSSDHKSAGIKAIAHAIRAMKPNQNPVRAYEKFCQLLRPCIRENMQSAFVKAVDEIMKLTDKIRPPADVVRSAIEIHKHAIFSKLNNKRASSTAVEFFRWAAGNSALGVQFVAPIVMAPLKQPVQWTAVLPRLEIIQSMLETYGPIDGCFEINQIISFVILPLDAPKPEVRKEAIAVLEMLVDLVARNQIVKMLQAANLPNAKKIIETIDQGR